MVRSLVTIVVMGASCSCVLHAQQRDSTRVHALDSIVVTAEPVRAAPPPVSTITADPVEVRRTQARNAWDLVRRATGIEVHEQGQGPGFASNAVLRGFSSDHSADVLLAVDGVPINLPIHGHVEGYNDWSLLAAPSVGSLRVLHGPASPLYGDFAFGGVVEVFTPSDLAHTGAQLGVSTFGDVSGWVRTGKRQDTRGFFAGFQGEREQGWRDNASYWLGSGSVRGWKRAGKGRLEGGLTLYGSDWRSPGFVSVAQFNADELTQAVDTSDGGDAQRIIASGRYSAPVGGPDLDVTGWVQGVRTHVFLNIPDDGVQAQQEEFDRRIAMGSQARLVWNGTGGEFTLGVSGRLDVSSYDRWNTVNRVREDPEILNDGRYASGAVLGRWRKLVGSRLALDLGARFDLLHYASENLLPGSSGGFVTATSPQFSPKLGARYFLGGSTALFGSFSRGFRGAPGVITDPSLPPLGVWAEELGIQVTTGSVGFEAALFRMDVGNERIQDPVSLEIVNTGASFRQGLWGRITWQATSRLALEADATFNDAEIKGTADSSQALALAMVDSLIIRTPIIAYHLIPPQPGDPVPGIAQYNARVGAQYRVGNDNLLGAHLKIGGPFTPLGEPDVRTQAFVLLELTGTIALGRGWPMLDLALQNALDTRYPEIRSSGFINPGTPRVLRVAFRYGN